MKKVIFALILLAVVVSGVERRPLVFANREIKNETSKKATPKPSVGVPLGGNPLSAAEIKATRKLCRTR